jgi:uncharacterized membrane protein
MKLRTLPSIIKDYFLAGLLVLAPVLIVAIVFQFIFGGLIRWIEQVPFPMLFSDQSSELAGFFKFLIVVGTLLVGVILVSTLGFLSRLYFGRKILDWLKEAIEKIPFFGSVYSSLDQLLKAFSSGGDQFNRVVYVEYPRKEVWAVAFVTGPANLKGLPPGYLSVFIPTVPNPTSGFHLMVKETEVIESGLKVDEAFKLILSLGIALP